MIHLLDGNDAYSRTEHPQQVLALRLLCTHHCLLKTGVHVYGMFIKGRNASFLSLTPSRNFKLAWWTAPVKGRNASFLSFTPSRDFKLAWWTAPGPPALLKYAAVCYVCCVLCAVCCELCSLYCVCVLCGVWCVQFTVYRVLHIAHRKAHTGSLAYYTRRHTWDNHTDAHLHSGGSPAATV